ncbi:MAG: adenosylmethionine decarboxylase [Algicola sp.]|nr:adenosylmethionine decarboxylase [Algicola sp.]
MFFEGSEKKVEITIDGDKMSLLEDLPQSFWAQMVAQCGAMIVSQMSQPNCKAFLLSESSLFVWHDRLLLITCGQTRLVNAVEYFVEKVDKQLILQLIYQRKNEYFASAQSSSFVDDVRLLNRHMPGVAYRFGELYSHHNYLYHLDNDYQSSMDATTCELLAYQISRSASAHLTAPGLTGLEIRQFLQLDKLVPGFTLDDHVFSPFGYSLNAIKGNSYLTIHVTPQSTSSYVSVEANFDLLAKAPLLLEILAPACFDLVCFNQPQFAQKAAQMVPKQYVSKELVHKTLGIGLDVCFANYIRPQHDFGQPTHLDLSSEHRVF